MDSKEQTQFKVVYLYIDLVLLQFVARHKKSLKSTPLATLKMNAGWKETSVVS